MTTYLWHNLAAVGHAEFTRQCWGLFLLAQGLREVGKHDVRTWQAAERKRGRRAQRNINEGRVTP